MTKDLLNKLKAQFPRSAVVITFYENNGGTFEPHEIEFLQLLLLYEIFQEVKKS